MKLAFLSKAPVKTVPTGPLAATILDEFARDLGLTPFPQGELLPWTEEEAALFERVIDEMFERTETSPEYP